MNLPNALGLLRIFLVAPFLVAIIYRHFPLALVTAIACFHYIWGGVQLFSKSNDQNDPQKKVHHE